MKRITKVFYMTLIMMFIVMPLLQSFTGIGKVNAEEKKERTVATVVQKESEIDAPLKDYYFDTATEVAIRQTVEYSYNIRFCDTFELKEITKSESEGWGNGSVHIFRCMDSDLHQGQILCEVRNVKKTKEKNGRYTITGVLRAKDFIVTGYTNRTTLYTMAEMYWGGFHPQHIYLRFSEKNFHSARLTWLIKPKAQVDWTNYFNNLYDVIPGQTTYTNSSYHYDNSTDSYPVDNVQSFEYQTVTPKNINTYAYVNINDDARRLYIRRLYKVVQNREPSSDDIVNFMKRNAQTNAIDVIMSKEAEEKNHINSMSNENFVRLAYKAILCRDPDATGLADYTRLLNNGVPKTAVLKELVESVEFRNYWNKPVKTLTFDAATCTAVFNYLNQNNFHILKTSNTTVKMFEYSINNVKKIDVSGKGVTNLNGMSQFPNLETLISNNNKLTNISEVSKLSNVKVLYLNNCGLGNIDNSPIKSMKKIEELHAENNAITARTFKFSGTPTIKKLYMNGNQIVTISEGLLTNNLKELYMDNNQVMNTEEVDYSNLTKISLKNNKNGLNSRGTKKIIPQIVKNAQNKSSKLYATNGVVFNKCKIVGNELVMDSGVGTATVTIKGGPADGTVITLKNIDIAQ